MPPRWAALVIAVAALAGCESREGDPDVGRAEHVVRQYLRAADRGDVARLCALKTQGALRRLGGPAACERDATRLALDEPTGEARRLEAAVDPGSADIVNTSVRDDRMEIWVDYGKAVIDSGDAVGGTILELNLQPERGRYRLSRVGFAVFVD